MRLELREITKQFPGVLANDKISIAVDKGEVLGMLGENGAGKTTLMNILSGLYKPDSGEILIDGETRVLKDPHDAIAAGVGMVHQHFMLVPGVRRGRGRGPRRRDRLRAARHVQPGRGAQADRRALRAVQARREPRREDREPAGRRPAARRDPQGPLPQERHPRPRRAERRPDPERDRGAVRHHPLARRRAGPP